MPCRTFLICDAITFSIPIECVYVDLELPEVLAPCIARPSSEFNVLLSGHSMYQV